MTAQAIVKARLPVESLSVQAESPISVVQRPELRERDFRSLEGKKVGSRRAPRADGFRFRDPETHAEMAVRVDRFIGVHLNPILEMIQACAAEVDHGSVVVVAHGVILNVLLKRLLTRFSTAAEVEKLFPGRSNLEWIASWRNTAYLEAVVSPKWLDPVTASTGAGGGGPAPVVGMETVTAGSDPAVRLDIIGVNLVDHLQGLKKTRGGIGSARFDTKQKTVDSFFKASRMKEHADARGGG